MIIQSVDELQNNTLYWWVITTNQDRGAVITWMQNNLSSSQFDMCIEYFFGDEDGTIDVDMGNFHLTTTRGVNWIVRLTDGYAVKLDPLLILYKRQGVFNFINSMYVNQNNHCAIGDSDEVRSRYNGTE